DHYALAEQHTSHFGPDVLTLQSRASSDQNDADQDSSGKGSRGTDVGVIASKPTARLVGETDLEFYRRKQIAVGVRRVSGDRLVAIVEIVSPGNKSSQAAFRRFVDKAVELLQKRGIGCVFCRHILLDSLIDTRLRESPIDGRCYVPGGSARYSDALRRGDRR